ncbi:aminotransferase class V-fold PLP-dependent enzyme [Fulvivirgaceae bacterium PWU4]|uniref:Aminotransferase class V-fold PLP-dependent enzyme n=1 Tax=Chryseosolibacter histidini TaxID=2782349 RepID=A0AAP2GKX4_9BACT|nr:aminotransferase class V-fold PLP-dependent enzyme [Chryseosolibacter histidini]MBT1699801.1 aminotransferase class V-fold PLP-dependent enzyme [Chryseosolibacter histidini]
MTNRRSFFRKSLGVAGALSLSPLAGKALAEDLSDALRSLNRLSPSDAATDEDLWARIAQAYTVSPTLINLNNGGVSPQPKVVQDAVDRYYHYSNEGPTYYMWGVLDRGREPLRRKLADLAGTSNEEVAVNRNTTEALGTVTYGLTLSKGDEVIMTKQDYPNMIQAWKQKELRDGIKIKWLNLELPIENDDTIVKAFTDATTARTRVWHITHMINWTGQILPVKKLCDEARKRNIISIVDGAHTFAQMDFRIPDFNPDYFGTSLHKWLCAPFGTGMLYVKKENIAGLWPLFPNDKPQSADIRKFETLGTRSFAQEQAIGQAIDFHNAIGNKRKEERLRYLKNYWCEKVKQHPRVKLNVSLRPEYACALGNFSIDGIEPETISSRMMLEHQIIVTAIKWENISGVRITPHVYTSLKDLDRFVEAVHKIAAS